MRTWIVNYKVGEQKIKENLELFQTFWEKVGEDYCILKGLTFDKNNQKVEYNG